MDFIAKVISGGIMEKIVEIMDSFSANELICMN